MLTRIRRERLGVRIGSEREEVVSEIEKEREKGEMAHPTSLLLTHDMRLYTKFPRQNSSTKAKSTLHIFKLNHFTISKTN